MIDDNRGPTLKKTLFWLHCMELGILIPPPGIELVPPALEPRSPNHWTSREVPAGVLPR